MGEQYGADQIQVLEGLEADQKTVLACTLAAHLPADSIIWFMRS